MGLKISIKDRKQLIVFPMKFLIMVVRCPKYLTIYHRASISLSSSKYSFIPYLTNINMPLLLMGV